MTLINTAYSAIDKIQGQQQKELQALRTKPEDYTSAKNSLLFDSRLQQQQMLIELVAHNTAEHYRAAQLIKRELEKGNRNIDVEA